MRKFKLKDSVARVLSGIPIEEKETSKMNSHDPLRAAEKKDGADTAPAREEIRFAWRTDMGKIRKINQDALILGNGLYGVADGMGGHKGGEIASGGLRDGLLRETEGKTPDPETMRDAVITVNGELFEQQEKDASLSGMGTTLTLIWPKKDCMIIGQVGDSRAYLLRDGHMRQVTQDHSMVAEMVRRGVLTEEQAASHPMRNYITRAVGTEDTIEIDITETQREKGDRWLICSDGLYGMMTRARLEELVCVENLEQAADELLQEALRGGGRDNISLILLQDDREQTEEKAGIINEAEGDCSEVPVFTEKTAAEEGEA